MRGKKHDSVRGSWCRKAVKYATFFLLYIRGYVYHIKLGLPVVGDTHRRVSKQALKLVYTHTFQHDFGLYMLAPLKDKVCFQAHTVTYLSVLFF